MTDSGTRYPPGLRAIGFLVVLVAASGLAVADEAPPLDCRKELGRLFSVLVEYDSAVGGLPASLLDLYREAWVEDPLAFFPAGTPERALAERWPERARPPLQLLSDTFEGVVARCGLDDLDDLHELYADGRIQQRKTTVDRFYGDFERPKFVYAASAEDYARPSARLGVRLVEVPTRRGKQSYGGPALVVQGVLPGYESPAVGTMKTLHPGDRLLVVNGYRVSTLEDLDGAMGMIGAGETFWIRFYRRDGPGGGELVTGTAPRSYFDRGLGPPPAPPLVGRAVEAYLSREGPGRLGVEAEDAEAGARVLAVGPASAAKRAGLMPGDVIVAIEDDPVRDMLELHDRVRTYRAGVTITIGLRRGDELRRVEATLAPLPDFDRGLWSFGLFAGQFNLEQAMRYAEHTTDFATVVALLEWSEGADAALEWLDAALAQPRSPLWAAFPAQLHAERGRLYQKRWNPPKALADYDAALEADPTAWSVKLDRAEVLWTLERYDESIKAYRELMSGPGGETLAFVLARKLTSIGRTGAARKLLKPLEDDPYVGERARALLEELTER